MSKTIVDMARIKSMLDTVGGREFIMLYKNQLGSYTSALQEARNLFPKAIVDDDPDQRGDCVTDDFTPEQSLTRLAYKLEGEIL